MPDKKSSDPTPDILEVKAVRKVYNQDLFKASKVAVANLSCRFPQGTCTGLMGHNGAGKTTTIKMIFGLIKADKGEIVFKGHSIRQRDRYDIGYMPETNKLPATLTPYETLDYQLRIAAKRSLTRAKRKELIRAKLQEVALWDVHNTQIKRLSKGLARRVAWAQATVHDPELIILDEPFSGMDPQSRHQMITWLASTKQRGKSVILCTHELTTAVEVCDNIHIVKDGSLVFSTCDKLENGDSSPTPTPGTKYGIHISGISADALETVASTSRLPTWQTKEQSGFLTKLVFGQYMEAAKWLSHCLAHGLVVPYFGEEQPWSAEQLIKFF